MWILEGGDVIGVGAGATFNLDKPEDPDSKTQTLNLALCEDRARENGRLIVKLIGDAVRVARDGRKNAVSDLTLCWGLFRPVASRLREMHELLGLAQASVDVIQRHPQNVVIASVGEALIPVAEAYSVRHGALEAARTRQTALVEGSGQATGELERVMSAWLGVLGRDVPGFDPSMFGRRPEVPLDMLSDARRVISVVQEQGTALSYAERVLAALQASAEAAEAAYTQAQNARIELQQKQAETRRLAATLQPHLVALRRALRAELGTSHFDYQRLRAERGRPEAEEGEDTEEAEAAPSTPAPVNGEPVPSPVPAAAVLNDPAQPGASDLAE